jgi:DNA polymerase-3 subunit delta'
MQFSDIIGQKEAVNRLSQMVAGDRIPHALLFLGPEGSGKINLALAFAQFAMCENKQGLDSCGQCRSCIKMAKFIHPDLHFSYPVVGSKVKSDDYLTQWRSAIGDNSFMNINDWLQLIGAANKQGNINKEECLNIIRKLSLKAFEGEYKILIMWLPEYLGKEGNRLLKLIEEPPENTLFVLLAEQQELILNTILSRCQLVKVPRLKDEEVIQGLEKKGLATNEQASSIAFLSGGNFNEAIKLAQKNENDNATLFLEWLRKCYKGNGVDLVKWVDKFAGIGRENQKYFLKYGLHFLRELLLHRVTGSNALRLGPQEKKTAQNLTNVLGPEQIEDISHLLSEVSYYIERNANPKVLFLDTSIQLHEIIRKKRAVGAS